GRGRPPAGGLSRRDGRWGAPRRRTGRGPAPRDRPLAGFLPPAGGALLLRGPHPRRGGTPAAMAHRHAPQPAGPRPREAPPRPDPPRLRDVDGPGRDPDAPIGIGVRLSPPVRDHDPGGDRLRGPTRRRGTRRDPGPGGA